MSDILSVKSPYDHSIVGEKPMQTASDLAKIYDNASDVKEGKHKLALADRIGILKKTADLVEGRLEAYSLEAASEGGKPLGDSIVELKRAVQGIREAANSVNGLVGREIPMNLNSPSQGRYAVTFREPIGIVTSISAFNHPFNLAVHQVIPAVAAGCPVIIKPALTTPLSCFNLLDCLYEAGLPKEWAQPLLCDNEVSEKLVTDPRNAFLSFIGSAKVGWMLRSKLPAGAHCALEHGGAAPVIFHADADLDTALPLLAKGGFYHAGQVCVSVQRLFCEEPVVNQVAEALAASAKKMMVGNPIDPNTEVGPLILEGEVDRVDEWVQEAVKGGGKLLTGGKKIGTTCYEPTVILNPPDDCRLSKEEIFGPVVAVYSYKTDQEALSRANNVPFSFQASVFGKDMDRIFHVVKGFEAAAVMVNDHTAFRVDWMPFGGRKASGMGVGGILPTMTEMTEEKLVVIKSPAFMA